MKRSLWVFGLALMLLGVTARAAEPPVDPELQALQQERFAETKQRILKRVQMRLQIMQDSLGCLEAANDFAAIKACHSQEYRQVSKMREAGVALSMPQKIKSPTPPAPTGSVMR